ncbi:MAG TPA: hypothetical protein ENK46_13120 [Flavobacteriia bacterium]|nr:hypothetical protein [Flavobacteriia bacterium]
MKKLTTLKGAKKLSKNEQKGISGGNWGRSCTQNGYLCCQTFSNGATFCDAGRCKSNGFCFWY